MLELLTSTELSVPLLQVALLLILSTVALLFGRIRLALLIDYCFTFYWGYFLNFDLFFEDMRIFNIYAIAYFSMGFVVLLVALFFLFYHRE